jgi:ABC-type cobalamin/Fe3+-siderophores transport system ATPase subunit
MEKIDRLGWADGLSFRCHGARIGIRVNDPVLLDRIRDNLPPGTNFSGSPVVDTLYSLLVEKNEARSCVRRFSLVYVGSTRLARTLEPEEALDTLSRSLPFGVAISSPRKLFVDAGVVASRRGAIVLLGPRGSGRSSLVKVLVRAGATYYSDRYAVIDTRAQVHPFPTPLESSEENGALPQPDGAQLDGRIGRAPVPIKLIVVTAFAPGARWSPKRLSPAQAVLALLEHTVLARPRTDFALAVLRQVALGAVTLAGRRGEAATVVEQLLNATGSTATISDRTIGRVRMFHAPAST